MLVCFELFQALLIWVEKLVMLFDQDHVHPHTYAIPTLGIHNHMLSIYYCSMRIKVTSLAIFHQERHGAKKGRENKEQKALLSNKEREREKRKKKSSHALSKTR